MSTFEELRSDEWGTSESSFAEFPVADFPSLEDKLDEPSIDDLVASPRARRWLRRGTVALLVLVGLGCLGGLWVFWQGVTSPTAEAAQTPGRSRMILTGTAPKQTAGGPAIRIAALPAGTPGLAFPGTQGGFMLNAEAIRTRVTQAVAQVLGLPTDTLSADLQQGQSVAQIAQAQHAAVSSVNAAYLAAVKAGLAQFVSAGDLTQAQADQLFLLEQHAIDQGMYFFLSSPPTQSPMPASGSTQLLAA
jgi:hypothetical protein